MSESVTKATPLAPPGPVRCTHHFIVNVAVNASPGTAVQAGMTVQLIGVAEGIEVLPTCDTNETSVPFHWSLFFQPPGGNETNVTSQLQQATTLNPLFLAQSEGRYRATLTGGDKRFGTKTAEVVISVAPPPPVALHVSGHVTSLLAHDVGGVFGLGNDFDVEVVVQLDTQPDQIFGFQLRNDKNRPARQSMFDLLRDAFLNNLIVTLDGSIVPGENNGLINQATLSR